MRRTGGGRSPGPSLGLGPSPGPGRVTRVQAVLSTDDEGGELVAILVVVLVPAQP